MNMISKETLLSLLPAAKETAGKEIISTCPFCNKEQHFFTNKFKFLYSCKKCGAEGNLKMLLRHLGRLDLLEGDSIGLTLNKLEIEENQEQIDLQLSPQRLPIGFTKLQYSDNNKYANYLKSRKFQPIDFDLIQPGYTNIISRYKDYVLLPIQRDLEIKGLVGRYVMDDDQGKRRYENSKGTNFGKLLLGIDEFTKSTTTVIVVEGPFDKISVTTELELHSQVEVKCVCTFGKKISVYQLALLARFPVQNLIFMYDVYDAINDMKRAGLTALKEIPNVYACHRITKKDPGTMDRREILKTLDTAEKIQNFVYNRVRLNPFK